MGELRSRCLADHDRAGGGEIFDDLRIRVPHPMLVNPAAPGGGFALGRREVLDRDRHPVERSQRLAPHRTGLGRLGRFQRLIGEYEAEAVQGGVDRLDALERVLDHLDR